MTKPPKNRLSAGEIFKLFSYIQNEHACGHITPGTTYQMLADKAMIDLKLVVTRANVEGAFQGLGIKLPETQRTLTTAESIRVIQDRLDKVEQELALLKSALGA